MPPQLRAALLKAGKPTDIDLEALKASESEGLLQHLVAQRGQLYRLIDGATKLGDHRAGSAIHGRLLGNLELTAKLLGDLRAGSQTLVQNILITAEYTELRSALIQALRPFPEARKAVAAVLRDIETRAGPPAIEGASSDGNA